MAGVLAHRGLVPVLDHRAQPVLAHCSVTLHAVKYAYYYTGLRVALFLTLEAQSS